MSLVCYEPISLYIVGPQYSSSTAKGHKKLEIPIGGKYLTKWIEAITLVHIMENDVRKYLWEDITYRFGYIHYNI